ATAGAACGGGGSSLLPQPREGMDPEQPASVNAEISAAAERRSMEQAMDTPLRSTSPRTMSLVPGLAAMIASSMSRFLRIGTMLAIHSSAHVPIPEPAPTSPEHALAAHGSSGGAQRLAETPRECTSSVAATRRHRPPL